VPFIAAAPDLVGRKLRAGGRLADVAPTLLAYLGLPKPAEMDGVSLLE
jgi:2,3-bisphosphoglycerate-independent phosphoglycerate mutase